MGRKTTTGPVLEQMVLPALAHGGYTVEAQVNIGTRFAGGKHIVDAIATAPNGDKFLVSLKWQQTSGTAEQKVPYEVLSLADAMTQNGELYKRAYVVLGGDKWTLRDFYTSGGLGPYLTHGRDVRIVGLETFISKANKAAL